MRINVTHLQIFHFRITNILSYPIIVFSQSLWLNIVWLKKKYQLSTSSPKSTSCKWIYWPVALRLIESGLLQRITSSSSVPRPLSVPSELTAARARRKNDSAPLEGKGNIFEYCFFREHKEKRIYWQGNPKPKLVGI